MTGRTTKTQAAVQVLAAELEGGLYPEGSLLPSEAQLGRRFQLSRMTVRAVLATLEQRGLVYRRQGKGTFATPAGARSPRTVAVLLKDLAKSSSPYLTELARGADACLAGRGSALTLVSTPPAGWPADFRRSLAGAIVIPHQITDDDLTILRALRLPHLVLLESDLAAPTVRLRLAAAAQALAEGLLTLGHRRFALISGHHAHADRHKRDGLAAAGLHPDALPDFSTDYRADRGQAAAEAVLALVPRPTAVICFDDGLALQVISAATAAGLRVPDDLSVTGFNDAPFSRLLTPAISTVRLPVADAGAAAAAALLEAAVTGIAPSDIELDHQVIWRGSTGPAPREDR